MQDKPATEPPLQLLQPGRAVLITLLAGPIELLLIWGLLCGQLRRAPPPPAGRAQGPRVLTSSQPQLKRARQGCCCANELCGLLGSAPGGAGRGWGGGWSRPWKGDLGPFPGRGSKDTPHLAHLAGWANRMSFSRSSRERPVWVRPWELLLGVRAHPGKVGAQLPEGHVTS